MGNMTVTTVIVVFINVMMFFTSTAMLSINPGASSCYNVEGSIIGNRIQRDTITGSYNNSVVDSDVLNDLPQSTSYTNSQSGSGSFVTDLFNNILSWFKSIPGLNYVFSVVTAPYNILKCMGLPVEFVVGIGTLWYLITFFVLISFLWWRD